MALFFKKKTTEVLSPLEGYNLWAPFYNLEANPVKSLSDELIKKLLPDLQSKRVLDAGCGTGKFCTYAEKQYALKITGIDLSSKMIDQARINCASAKFICADLSEVTIEEKSFDVIICALVLAHIEHLPPVLNKLLKALKAGGALIVTDFHPFLTLAQSKRTFRDQNSGQTFEVQHHLHLFEEYYKCFIEQGVFTDAFEEPLYNGAPVIFGIRVRNV